MSISVGAITVADSATLVVDANNARTRLKLHNNGTNDIYIGDSNVTTSTGFPLVANSVFELERITEDYRGAIYAIVAEGTEDLRYWEGSI